MFNPDKMAMIETLAEVMGDVKRPLTDFERRIGKNMLQIIAREIAQGPDFFAGLEKRLEPFCDGKSGSLNDKYQKLALKISDGVVDYKDKKILELLRYDALARLSIDQPTYKHELNIGGQND